MRYRGSFEQARIQGSLEAARQLLRSKVDQTQAIDVYAVIREANLWLLFEPMDDLWGAYLPYGGGGVLINANRSKSVQRLTAAHEYGHHVLGHAAAVDHEREVEHAFDLNRIDEAAAWSFAADFLMPPRLVNSLYGELDLPQNLQAHHAYQLSLFLGTSYNATVRQLVAQRKISIDIGTAMLRVPPSNIKRMIGKGVSPAKSHAEVWPVDGSDAGRQLVVSLDDEISLCLPETPSTGFRWMIDTSIIADIREDPDRLSSSPSNAGNTGQGPLLGLVRTVLDPVDRHALNDRTGIAGSRYTTFRALGRGELELKLSLMRPWEKDAKPKEVFNLCLHIEGKPTGDLDHGYLCEYKEDDLALASVGAP